ncbi:hypothetical protein C8R44DRAFT_754010 [Mycena epipterygia]|nr:hypothetical protein C8R44DRAFT_754010 [Mycena epipterygia]
MIGLLHGYVLRNTNSTSSRKPTYCIQLLHGSKLLPTTVLQDALADKTYSKPDFLSVFWHQYQAEIIPSCKQPYRSSARVQASHFYSYYPGSPELRPVSNPKSLRGAPHLPSRIIRLYQWGKFPFTYIQYHSLAHDPSIKALIIALKSTFQTSGIGECYCTAHITLAAIWARALYPTRIDPARCVHILLPTSPQLATDHETAGGACAQL